MGRAREQSATDGPWLWLRSGTVVQHLMWCFNEPSGDSGEQGQDVAELQYDPPCLNDVPPSPDIKPSICEVDMLHRYEF